MKSLNGFNFFHYNTILLTYIHFNGILSASTLHGGDLRRPRIHRQHRHSLYFIFFSFSFPIELRCICKSSLSSIGRFHVWLLQIQKRNVDDIFQWKWVRSFLIFYTVCRHIYAFLETRGRKRMKQPTFDKPTYIHITNIGTVKPRRG